jgi:phosphoglycerate dehydrogenase-like enzyme
MTQYTVSCLDVFTDAVQGVIRGVAPAEFEFRFAKSYDKAEQTDLVAAADFILVGGATLSRDMIERASRARLVQKWGIGVDKIDLDAARERGLPVAITAGANASPVAELAVGLMLAVYRRIALADRRMREGTWVKAEMRSWCYQIDGKTVGIIGFGAIGRMVAHRLRGFDANILYYDIVRPPQILERALRAKFVPFDELIAKSDIVTLHTPLTDLTDKMIDGEVIGRMKPGAVLINTARGEIVDEAALAAALRSGKLRGAGLDTFEEEPIAKDHPFLKLDNMVLTPHAGGGVFDNVENVARHALGNMVKVLDGAALAAPDVIVPAGPGIGHNKGAANG